MSNNGTGTTGGHSGVVAYGTPGMFDPPSQPIPQPNPFFIPNFETGRDMRQWFEALMEKKQAVVAVQKTDTGFKVRISLDGKLVSETEIEGASAAITVGL